MTPIRGSGEDSFHTADWLLGTQELHDIVTKPGDLQLQRFVCVLRLGGDHDDRNVPKLLLGLQAEEDLPATHQASSDPGG